MKIIKHGYTDFRTQCISCGCVFEYNIRDLKTGVVRCPECGCEQCHDRIDAILESRNENAE